MTLPTESTLRVRRGELEAELARLTQPAASCARSAELDVESPAQAALEARASRERLAELDAECSSVVQRVELERTLARQADLEQSLLARRAELEAVASSCVAREPVGERSFRLVDTASRASRT